MPNEFVIGSGFIATNNSTVTGSLTVTGGITGSLLGTSSWASNAVSSSYALTSSYAMSVSGGIIGTGTSNYVSKFTGTNTLGNSQITDNGTLITLGSAVAIGGTSISSGANLEVKTSSGGTIRLARDPAFGNVQNATIGRLEFYNYDADVTPGVSSYIGAAYEDIYGQLTYISIGTSGYAGLAERLRIYAFGQLRLNTYTGSGAWPGTIAGYLAVDTSGNVITAVGAGSGTVNYIPKWTTTTSLSNSQITDNGSLVTLGNAICIGTNSISTGANVEIKTSTGGVLRISRDQTSGFVQNASLGKIEFYNYDADVPGPLAGASISAAYEDIYGQRTYLSFGTDPYGGAVERVRITSAGRLLVGGTTADDGINTFQVSGSGKFAANVIATSFTGSLFGTSSYATSASYALTASYAMNGGGGGATNQIASGNATASISPTTGFVVNTNSTFSGSANITGSITASAVLVSGSGIQRLTVIGSGSASPLFTVQGSQGELFTVTDSLSGSLFSVGDISGLPILEVFSDSTTLMGSFVAPALYTTYKILSSAVGVNTIYSLATASYDGVFVDYTIKSGSNARAGTFTAIWSGSSVNYMDNSTTDFGTTTGFVFGANISAGNMIVSGSGTSAGWTVKTIIKAI